MTHLEKVGQHFDDRAARYDNPWTAFVGEQELRVIRQFVPPGATVLDYGCGTGRTTLDHLRRSCAVTAYDLSGEMLAVAQAKAKRQGLSAEFTLDAQALAGRTWPWVTCIGVLDYYPDPVPLLKTVRDYLAPQGRLVVTYPDALSPLGWLYALGSRFTFPATPRTPHFARKAAAHAGLRVLDLRFAFPSVPALGHTLVLALARR